MRIAQDSNLPTCLNGAVGVDDNFFLLFYCPLTSHFTLSVAVISRVSQQPMYVGRVASCKSSRKPARLWGVYVAQRQDTLSGNGVGGVPRRDGVD